MTRKQSPEPAPDARFYRGKRGPSPSTSGPPCQRDFRPRARAPAKQPPTRATTRFPRNMDSQCLRAVMMERSRPSCRPRCPAHNCAHIHHDGQDYLDEASPSYNHYNHE
jgi:hypothetical protein